MLHLLNYSVLYQFKNNLMKKIFLLLSIFVLSKVGYSQFPVIQYIGSDSTIVKSRGGLQGRFAPIPFTDTTSANLSRISQYPGALIYTTGVDKYWYRNATTTGWIEFTSSGGSTVNIYNSNGSLTSDRNLDGTGFSLGFHTLSKFWTQSDTVDIELLSTGAKVFNIHNLTETQDTTTYKPIVVDPVTGRVLQSSYWYGSGGGSGADSSIFATVYRTDTLSQNLRNEIGVRWSLLGNSGALIDGEVIPFLGTTDAYPLTIKANNVYSGYFGASNPVLALGKNAFRELYLTTDGFVGTKSLAIGESAGYGKKEGDDDILIGHEVAFYGQGGVRRIAIGNGSIERDTSGSDQVVIGYQAQTSSNPSNYYTTSKVTAIGNYAGLDNELSNTVHIDDGNANGDTTLERIFINGNNMLGYWNQSLVVKDSAYVKQMPVGGTSSDSVVVIGADGKLKKRNTADFGGGGGDTSYFIIDTLYNRLATVINADSIRLKSLRIQRNGTNITPTSTDSTLSFNVLAVDSTQLIVIDTTGATTGQIAYIDRTGGDTIKFKNDSVGTGGSSGSGAFSKLEWFSVDEFAPAVGDSIMVHDSFAGKYLDVYRNGIKQPHVVEDTGWARVNDTTISVLPPFAANEFWHIEARDSTAYTQLVLQDPGSVPSTTIAYATSADGGNNGGSGTSRTWSHTVSSGTDRYLFVGFVGDTNAGNDDVSSVTYNGVSMTLVSKQLQNVNSGNRWTYVYGLANPASGAHNVVVTFASSHWILGGSIEYTGVQGIDTYNSQTGFVTNLTSTITTGVDNCWTFIFSTSNGNAQTAGSGSTLRLQAADNFWTWFDSGSAVTPAGSKSMNTARPLGAGITHIMISIKPY